MTTGTTVNRLFPAGLHANLAYSPVVRVERPSTIAYVGG
jgi:hypothetical protein